MTRSSRCLFRVRLAHRDLFHFLHASHLLTKRLCILILERNIFKPRNYRLTPSQIMGSQLQRTVCALLAAITRSRSCVIAVAVTRAVGFLFTSTACWPHCGTVPSKLLENVRLLSAAKIKSREFKLHPIYSEQETQRTLALNPQASPSSKQKHRHRPLCHHARYRSPFLLRLCVLACAPPQLARLHPAADARLYRFCSRLRVL